MPRSTPRNLLLALATVLCFASAAHAQIFSIYATSSNYRFSNVQTGAVYSTGSGSGVSGYTNQFTNFWGAGIGGGVTLNFLPVGPVKIGLDVRGSTKPGTNGADTALVGLRLGFKLPTIKIKPYVQASGGYVSTRTNNVSTIPSGSSASTAVGGTFTNKYAAYEITGGIDYPLIHFVDFRIVDIGAGQGYGFDLSSSTPTLTLFHVGTGVVVHF